MIRIDLSPRARALLGQIKELPKRTQREMARAMDKQNELTIGVIARERMSQRGPSTLGVVTGRLRRSVSRSRARVFGHQIIGAIGTNVEYAGVHEFGFTGKVEIGQFTRRNRSGDIYSVRGAEVSRRMALRMGILHQSQAGQQARESGRYSFSRRKAMEVASGFAVVKAHTREMKIPARAPIRRGIESRAVEYGKEFSAAIVRAVEGTA